MLRDRRPPAGRRDLRRASTRRVDEQFERGLLDEIRGAAARGVPETARPFGGLVYRQALEHLHGVRDEAATRALIAQENRRYARRQLIWFRKEPNLHWLDGPGESPATIAAASRLLESTGSNEILPLPDRRLHHEPSSSSSTASASASCRTRPRTATRAATRSATSRSACRSQLPTLRGARSRSRRGARRSRRAPAHAPPAPSDAWRKRRPARTRSPATGR